MEDKIKQDLKNSQLQKDEVSVSTLRLLLSEITNLRIQKGGEVSDSEVVSLVQKELKKRKESAESFRTGGREELAQKEEAEAAVLEKYLPAQLSDEELTKVVLEAIKEVGANSVSDMGKVIGLVMGRVSGKADGARVSLLVKQNLAQN